ncbi:MAG: DNA repair protein RecN [Acidimicrobiales bacterium]
MLSELRVCNLGVIEELSLLLSGGMTAVTGETGAGKTLVVTAIELLVGGKAEVTMVRSGATEAIVEGRFDTEDGECIIRRVIPAKGRSRGYIDGALVTIAELSAVGARLVDLHGQHDHQSLLTPSVQRNALDRFGGIDLEPLRIARRSVAEIEARRASLGGDPRDRAREIDLLRFQVNELLDAGLDDPQEDDALRKESELLSDATGFRDAASAALRSLGEDGGSADSIGIALVSLGDRALFSALAGRLREVQAEIGDVVRELRAMAESIESDPERLATIGDRRKLLQDLRRKYGDSVSEVIVWRDEAFRRLGELEAHDTNAAALDAELVVALDALRNIESKVGAARSKAAPALAKAVVGHLPELALPKARLEVDVAGVAGREVTFRFAANPGMELQPLAKVASGGELARAMLALRMVLTEGPPVLVFDEVDAGIGGAAAVAVGRSLASLGSDHQVLVVTHLAQVAGWADSHIVVDKVVSGATTVTTIAVVAAEERITELARMLSGTPESTTARQHARELLESSTR